jgi:hypothetical protein
MGGPPPMPGGGMVGMGAEQQPQPEKGAKKGKAGLLPKPTDDDIKKYDLPTQTHSHFQIKKKTKNHRIVFNQTPTVDTRKIKNLLSSLIEEPIYSPKPIKSKDGNQ